LTSSFHKYSLVKPCSEIDFQPKLRPAADLKTEAERDFAKRLKIPEVPDPKKVRVYETNCVSGSIADYL
jgi:hypothetical protein